MKIQDLAQKPRIETLGLGNRDLKPCSDHFTPLSIEKGGDGEDAINLCTKAVLMKP